MARKTKEEALRTRQLLIESAIQQFALRGSTNTPLTDIADAAGVTRGAVYWILPVRRSCLMKCGSNSHRSGI